GGPCGPSATGVGEPVVPETPGPANGVTGFGGGAGALKRNGSRAPSSGFTRDAESASRCTASTAAPVTVPAPRPRRAGAAGPGPAATPGATTVSGDKRHPNRPISTIVRIASSPTWRRDSAAMPAVAQKIRRQLQVHGEPRVRPRAFGDAHVLDDHEL